MPCAIFVPDERENTGKTGQPQAKWTCPKDSAYVSDFKRNMEKNQSVPERIRTSDLWIRSPQINLSDRALTVTILPSRGHSFSIL